jgi:hypothetical protein
MAIMQHKVFLKWEVLHIPSTTARALVYRTAVQQRQLRAKWLLCSTTFFEMGGATYFKYRR